MAFPSPEVSIGVKLDYSYEELARNVPDLTENFDLAVLRQPFDDPSHDVGSRAFRSPH